jgi:hypothetical protein
MDNLSQSKNKKNINNLIQCGTVYFLPLKNKIKKKKLIKIYKKISRNFNRS